MIELTIPGEPVAAGRPRFSTAGGFARAYDPPKSRQYKKYIQTLAESVKPAEPLEMPLTVTIKAYMGIPKSKPRKWREAAAIGLQMPTKKPDADNIARCVTDAVNGVLWRDDSQIVRLTVSKHYSDEPRVEVTITDYKM